MAIVPAFWELYYSLNCEQKVTKMGQKLIKIVQKLRCFLHIFRIYSLKNFADGRLGATAPVALCLRPCYSALRDYILMSAD